MNGLNGNFKVDVFSRPCIVDLGRRQTRTRRENRDGFGSAKMEQFETDSDFRDPSSRRHEIHALTALHVNEEVAGEERKGNEVSLMARW